MQWKVLFLVEKRNGDVKARVFVNGSTERAYTPKGESSSPTVDNELILLTGVIETK